MDLYLLCLLNTVDLHRHNFTLLFREQLSKTGTMLVSICFVWHFWLGICWQKPYWYLLAFLGSPGYLYVDSHFQWWIWHRACTTNKERYTNNFLLNFLESATWKTENGIVLTNIIFKNVASNIVVTYNLLD